MSKLKPSLTTVLIAFASLMFLSAEAQTVVIMAPAPRETVVVPPGSVQCKYIPAGKHHGRYAEAHRVCYARHGHVEWVSGHWECTKFNAWKGTCRNWVWVPSYWKGKH